MKFTSKSPPRDYLAGTDTKVAISDCGTMELAPDEQITFVTPAGGELDVTRKEWGYYATPSLNKRLIGFGLRAVLVRNAQGDGFLLVVEDGKRESFDRYCDEQKLEILRWLDTAQAIAALK